MTFGQGAHRVRLFRRFDTWPVGRHPMTTGADGALHSALLRCIVSRVSGGYSTHVVRISYTLSRDTTQLIDVWMGLLLFHAQSVRRHTPCFKGSPRYLAVS